MTGPVPLLPKPTPSSEVKTFTFVPVAASTHQQTNVHIVAAPEAQFCTSAPSSQDGN